METHSSDEARRSLEAIGASRQEVAGRLRTPRWYYPVLGALVAQMILAYGLAGSLVSVLSALLVALGAGWLLRTYTGRTGIVAKFPTAARSGLMLALFALGLLVPTLAVVFAQDLATSTVVLLAAAAFVSTLILGPAYDAVYRADLRRGEVLR